MRRFLFLALLAASLMPLPGPARAQATADQLNKLSLEALTATPAGGRSSGASASRRYYHSYAARRFRRTGMVRSRYYGHVSRRAYVRSERGRRPVFHSRSVSRGRVAAAFHPRAAQRPVSPRRYRR